MHGVPVARWRAHADALPFNFSGGRVTPSPPSRSGWCIRSRAPPPRTRPAHCRPWGSISREHFQEARCSRYTAHIFSPTVGIFLSIGHGSGAEAERWDSSYTGEGGGIQGNEVEVLRSSNLKALDHMQVFVTEEP